MIIFWDQAAICIHWGQLVAEKPLIDWYQVTLLSSLPEFSELLILRERGVCIHILDRPCNSMRSERQFLLKSPLMKEAAEIWKCAL